MQQEYHFEMKHTDVIHDSLKGVLYLSVGLLRDDDGSIAVFLYHGLRAEGKAICADPKPSPATGGNRFPPLDHRGRVILNLRLLLWHRGMSPLRLQNTHAHTNTYRLYTHTGRFLTPTKQGNTFHTEKEREGETNREGGAPEPQLLLDFDVWK